MFKALKEKLVLCSTAPYIVTCEGPLKNAQIVSLNFCENLSLTIALYKVGSN